MKSVFNVMYLCREDDYLLLSLHIAKKYHLLSQEYSTLMTRSDARTVVWTFFVPWLHTLHVTVLNKVCMVADIFSLLSLDPRRHV